MTAYLNADRRDDLAANLQRILKRQEHAAKEATDERPAAVNIFDLKLPESFVF
jgi:hypothetical protein